MKKSHLILSLFLISPLLFSCSSGDDSWIKYNASSISIKTNYPGEYVSPFNTVMGFNYFKSKKKTFKKNFDEDLIKLYEDSIVMLHKQFDRHYYYEAENGEYYSSIKAINDAYGTGIKIPCSDDLILLLKESIKAMEDTNGYFNPFSGNLVTFWDDVLEGVNNYIPLDQLDPLYSSSQKEKLDKLTYSLPSLEEGKKLLNIDEKNNTVIFNSLDSIIYKNENLERDKVTSLYRPILSVGGIAKGVANDIIKKRFIKKGYKDGWLNSGSSSITLLSSPSQGKQNISFVDPRNPLVKEVAFSISLLNESALSTSGNYTEGKSYTILENNIHRHHIFNPYTGENEQFHQSVSVYSSSFSSGQLDAFSTAFFSLSVEDGLKLRKELLSKYKNSSLELIYVDLDENNNLEIKSTSSFSNTLVLKDNESKVIYLE